MEGPWNYPAVRRDDSVYEERCGIRVEDPYRWLEDPDSEETRAFVKAQNEITMPYLSNCPARDRFNARYVCKVFHREGSGLQALSIYPALLCIYIYI